MSRNILRSKDARSLLNKGKRVAELLKPVLQNAQDFDKVKDQVGTILDEQLKKDEYVLVIDGEGRALRHTNRLREGIVFNDETGMKAAKADAPLLQLYSRNTGEMVIDAAVPIFNGNGYRYNLRAGRIVHRPFLGPLMFGLALVPTLVTAAVVYITSAELLPALWGAGAGLLLGLLTGIWGYNKLSGSLDEWYQMTRKISSGDLTALLKPKGRNKFDQMGYELNKVVLGMKSIVEELSAASETTKKVSEAQSHEASRQVKEFQALSMTMQEFTKGTEEQLASLENALSMINEMLNSSKEMKKTINISMELSEDAFKTAHNGTESAKNSARQMQEIQLTVEDLSGVIEKMAADSQDMVQQVSAITDIARQTNMLALNASIEASRAGESGRGFAVVASEVRKLAEETSSFAEKILAVLTGMGEEARNAVSKVQYSVEQINEGVTSVESSREAIQHLDGVVKKNREQVIENNKHAELLIDHSTELEAIMDNLTQISEEFTESASNTAATVDSQVKGIENLATDAEQLLEQSHGLDRIVKRFTFKSK